MNCQHALERVGDLVDGDLSRGERVWLQLHLLLCRQCRRYLATYRATIRVTRAVYAVSERSTPEFVMSESRIAAILAAVRGG
ncbi:MAG: zf-HC2 domain-containing protein [Planctomycetes bacterium]|nr:zf-HC2 domain-containing protein [Planctomycetota bacterium]